jgi:hypothetical protein
MKRFIPLVLLLIAAAPVVHDASGIRVTNHIPGETVRYPVVLLRGTLDDLAAEKITVTNLTSKRSSRTWTGVAYKGRFKTLAELVPGDNTLSLRVGSKERRFGLVYKPQTNPYKVRVVWLTDKSGDERYLAPDRMAVQDYRSRVDVAMKLMQTFTAERMNDLGYGRVTFSLDFDEHGRVPIQTMKGHLSAEEYHELSDQDRYRVINRWLNEKENLAQIKTLAFTSFTRYDAARRKGQSHAHLGNGNLALSSTAGVYTWPASLDEVQSVLADSTPLSEALLDDSALRGVVWAQATTTIGSALHELGHAFGLPHSKERFDIMTRGFDFMNRAFVLWEPPSKLEKSWRLGHDIEIPAFQRVSAGYLAASRWFALDQKPWPKGPFPRVFLDSADRVQVRSRYGVRYYAFDKDGDALRFREFRKEPANELSFEPTDLPSGSDASLRIIDDQGQTTTEPLGALREQGRYVRSWRFAPKSRPWPDRAEYPPLDKVERREIEELAAKEKLQFSEEGFIDFLKPYPDKRDQAGYAYRTIETESEQTIKILAGSDDSLRIWVNGKRVIEFLGVRHAQPDENEAKVVLKPGVNQVLVEVARTKNMWGLYFRLQDENGNDLRLSDTGHLSRR